MKGEGRYIVVDVGKTLSKVTLRSSGGTLLERRVRKNDVSALGCIPRLDIDGIGAWLRETLALFADHPVEAIIPVAHGAGVVALREGKVLFPPLDYEAELPANVAADYAAQRDTFVVSGSPRLPAGLNLGAQLHWLEQLHSAEMARATLVPWAQYWGWFLSGVAVSEVTSLGCHTDLWEPAAADFSPMAKHRGWAGRFAPMAAASDVVDALHPDLAAETGLCPTTKVLAGLHDSNAALLAARGFPEIGDEEATVLSTGTWFVAMRHAPHTQTPADLPEARDALMNVDVHGKPVPSARFMGGREIEQIVGIDVDVAADQERLLTQVPDVIENDAMLLPTLTAGCGPFPDGDGRWLNRPDSPDALRTAACLYAALVTDEILTLIGTNSRLLIEGRFAAAEVFTRAIATLRPETQVFVAQSQNDVSFSALRLINPALKPAGQLRRVLPLEFGLNAYRQRWRNEIKRKENAGEREHDIAGR